MDGDGTADLPGEVSEGFSGVVAVHRGGELVASGALGLADRTFGVPNRIDFRYGLASITKVFTATAVLALVGDGRLHLDQTARSVLGEDLPLIADDVTIDHLLTHRSGIGDYYDEESGETPTLKVPVQQLDSAEAYLAAIDGFPSKFGAGERFSYSNGGFVALAIIGERVAGTPYADLVQQRVFDPAGMASSDFAPTDRLAPGTATGYCADGATNVFRLPLVGVGDGGAHSTVDDLDRFWRALTSGTLLPGHLTTAMLDEVTCADATGEGLGYGRGVWRDEGRYVVQGGDEGVATWSEHDPATGTTITLLANEETDMYLRVQAMRRRIADDSLLETPTA